MNLLQPMTPQVLAGKYLVQEELAHGGMGVIYRALDRTLNRIVAIKLVHSHLSGDPSFAERFMREARAMARLQHDNIVTIYAVEEDRNTQFLVMEFCAGQNLRDVIRSRRPLSMHNVVRLSQHLASALAYAHAHGVVHRDIKPANVLVDQKGKAKLTDFGIAAALDEAGLTLTGQVVGTPEYMSPEQAQGLKPNGRSDLYSLGIVMYELLTGQTPYAATSKTSILVKLASDRNDLILQFPDHVPSLVQGVVRDLLRRDPAERLPDANILASQLHEILFTLPQEEMKESHEADKTIVLAPEYGPAAPLPLSKYPNTNEAVHPRNETISQDQTRRSAATRPIAHASPSDLIETIAHPAPPTIPPRRTSPEPEPPPMDSSSPMPNRPSVRLFPLIGGGLMVVAILSGLIFYFMPQEGPIANPVARENPIEQVGRERGKAFGSGPSEAELENQRIALEEEQKRLDDKRRQAEAQQAKEEAERKQLESARERAEARRKEDQVKRFAEEEKKQHQLEEQRRADDMRRQEDERKRAQEQQQWLAEGQRIQREKEEAATLAKIQDDKRRSEEEQRLVAKEQDRRKGEEDRLQREKEEAALLARKKEDERKSTESQMRLEDRKTQDQRQHAAAEDDKKRTQALNGILEELKASVIRRDLESLERVTTMSEGRRRMLLLFFERYVTIDATILDVNPGKDGATAVLKIHKLIQENGNVVTPDKILRTTNITIPREGDGWGKPMW